MDAGNYAESWEQAGEYFHEAMSQAEWVEALNNVRAPFRADAVMVAVLFSLFVSEVGGNVSFCI